MSELISMFLSVVMIMLSGISRSKALTLLVVFSTLLLISAAGFYISYLNHEKMVTNFLSIDLGKGFCKNDEVLFRDKLYNINVRINICFYLASISFIITFISLLSFIATMI